VQAERKRAPEQTFASFLPRPGTEAAVAAAKALAHAQGKPWLTLVGPRGCGKSHLAQAIVGEWCATQGPDADAHYLSWPDFWRSCLAAQDGHEQAAMVEQVKGWRMVVLDEVADQSATPASLKAMEEIADWRYQAGAPTVYISDWPRNRWPAGALVSRTDDVAMCANVAVTAGSYRLVSR